MPRLYTLLVFDGTIRGTAEVYTSPQHNDALGRADDCVIEYEVSEASGGSPTLTVKHYHSCSQEDGAWKLKNTVFSAVSLSSLPVRDTTGSAGDFAGFARLGFTLGGSTPVARLRVWVTGRSN